jgi:Tfp pilus assembly protein PilO
MELANIIAAVVLSGVVVGSVVWLKKSLQQHGEVEESLLDELNSKIEMVAAIPFLKQQVAELQSKEDVLHVSLGEYRDKFSQKDI